MQNVFEQMCEVSSHLSKEQKFYEGRPNGLPDIAQPLLGEVLRLSLFKITLLGIRLKRD